MAKAKNSNTREKKTTSLSLFTDTKKKVNYIAVIEEQDISVIVDTALNEYIDKYEKKNGAIPVK